MYRSTILVLSLCLCAADGAFAQAPIGTIAGTVTDASGSVIF
jgi:hypothetical protein